MGLFNNRTKNGSKKEPIKGPVYVLAELGSTPPQQDNLASIGPIRSHIGYGGCCREKIKMKQPGAPKRCGGDQSPMWFFAGRLKFFHRSPRDVDGSEACLGKESNAKLSARDNCPF